MKVKYSDLAKVLKMSAASITMAIKRGKLNKTLDGQIDLDDQINHAWIIKRLTKQGCEIPQKISALFKATPLTENEKNKGNRDQPELPGQAGDNAAPEGDEEGRQARSEAIQATQRTLDKARAREAEAKAITAEIKAANLRRELIKINPFARLLFNIKSAERTKILNSIPNIAQTILDEIKSALNENKTDTEMLVMIKDIWQSDLAKIYKDIDRELQNKLRQAKDKLEVTDDEPDNEIDHAA